MRRFLVVLIVAITALAGCGSAGSDSQSSDTTTDTSSVSGQSGTGSSASEAEATITIDNFAYGEPLTVAPGATIRVVNSDAVRHDVDALNGAFETDLLDPNSELTFTAPTEPGTYEYTCSLHPQMRGTLIVEAADN